MWAIAVLTISIYLFDMTDFCSFDHCINCSKFDILEFEKKTEWGWCIFFQSAFLACFKHKIVEHLFLKFRSTPKQLVECSRVTIGV